MNQQAALDVVVEREIMEEIFELKDHFGFSVLFISHDLSLMGEITDRIGVMYGGKLLDRCNRGNHGPSQTSLHTGIACIFP